MITVIAKLDKSSRARLSWIQSFAASFGIVPRPIYGHIPICSIEEGQIEGIKAALADQKAFSVDFTSVEVLREEKMIAALATREGALEDIHAKLCPGADWVPHTELLRDNVMDLGWVCSAMAGMFQPFTATISRIEFMDGTNVIDGMDLEETV